MSEVYVMQRAYDDMELVALGACEQHDGSLTGLLELARKRFNLFKRTIEEIGRRPLSGKRDAPVRIEVHSPSQPSRVLSIECWTFHLNAFDPLAVHQFLYRIVGEGVEIGRLLHQEMKVQDHVPAEWLVEAGRKMQSDAA